MNYARFLFGMTLVALGVIFILDVADVVDAGDVIATWWPIMLIAVAGIMVLDSRRRVLAPGIIALAGLILLLNNLDVIDAGPEVVLPAALIVIGLALAFGRPRTADSSEATISAFAAFSGTEAASHSKHFEGGTIGAVFGGAEVDLRDAELAPEASLDVFTAFGGAEVKVPEGWRVTTHGVPIFGAFENVTTGEHLPEDAPILDISATVLFGAVEVKH